jgi:hypothetical protein
MEGFAELIGGIPLVVAHGMGIVLLLVTGVLGYRGTGPILAVLALSLASGLGIGVAQVIFEGELFVLGIHNDTPAP